MGCVSLGTMVGIMPKQFCRHIVTVDLLETTNDYAIYRVTPVSEDLVTRGDSIRVVTGWFIWLAMDMCTARWLSDVEQLTGMTTSSNVEFLRAIRKPDFLLKVCPVVRERDNYTTQIEIFNGDTIYAKSTFVFKCKDIK
jgi:acyl-coenzyme A thioesterase PaaI-like protein